MSVVTRLIIQCDAQQVASVEYARAVELAESVTVASPIILEAQYAFAHAYSGLGSLWKLETSSIQLSRPPQIQSWQKARDSYEQSLAAWQED